MNKQIQEMSFEEIKQIETMGLNDTFHFTCKACGKCCKNRRDIVLTPYDVFRIARYLGRTPEEIITRYCQVYEGHESHFPVVWLQPIPPNDTCPFLRNRKCVVHAAKPVLCRVYPLARIFQGSGNARFYFNGSSCSHDPKTVTVREWIADVALEECEGAGRIWTDILRCLLPSIHTENILKKEEDRHRILGMVYANLWLPYDTQADFTPQLKKNYELLQANLQEQFQLAVPLISEII